LPIEKILSLLQHLLHHLIGLGIVIVAVAVGIILRGVGFAGGRRPDPDNSPRHP